MSPALPSDEVGTLAARLAEHLPADDIRQLAAASLDGTAGIGKLTSAANSQILRNACAKVAAALHHGANGVQIAGALTGALAAVQRARESLAVDVVWTGPDSGVHTSRLTSAVIVELIDQATEELLLVSYAAHPPAELTSALQRAVARGVDVTVLLERSVDKPGFHGPADPFPGLPARRWAWPGANRPAGASLHAKVLVVDGRETVIGSANLTGHAFTQNLECGVRIRNRRVAKDIREHLHGLYAAGALIRV